MNDNIYTITLEDGTQIENLRLNGNNYISQNPISSEIFDGNLGTVTISDGETEETHENMALVQITQMNGQYWFVLRDIPENEIMMAKMRSDLDYLSMMTDVEF